MSVRTLVLSCLLVSLVAVAPRPAHAQDPNRVFAGRIITSNKRFPTYAKSANSYIKQIRKQSKKDFHEDKASHTWMVYFAAFLRQPLNDVEYKIRFYELRGRSQQLIATSDQFTDTRGEKTIISKIKLDKQLVGVNKELLMTLENKGKVLASGRLRILGEGEHYTGKVDFSSDEAK